MGQETPEGNALLASAGVKPAEPVVTPAAPVEPVVTPAEPEVVEPVAPTPGDPAANPADDESKKRRVRPRTDLDHQVLDLYKSDGFKGTFQEAVAVIYGQAPKPDTGQAPKPEVTTPPVDPMAEIDRTLETRRTEVSDLEKQIDEAAELMDTPKALKLQRELTRKESEIAKLEDLKATSADRQQAAVDTAFQTRAAAAKAEALDRYPQLADKDSIVRKQFDVFLDKAETDPELSPLFKSPRWPALLAEEFARQGGLAPAPKKPATPAAAFDSTTAAPRATHAKVLTSTTTPPVTPAATSETELRALLPKLTPAQLRGLMTK